MKIGPYEVVSQLGRGGMGIVFHARSAEGADVALKLLLKITGQRLARFERERRLLAAFREEDGFVPLLDAGESTEGPYIVMGLVDGGTLRHRLRRGPLGIEETLQLGRELATALARAHELGIVHRDLKPENVLYTRNGRPLLADLGLAKHFDDQAPGASQSVSLSADGSLQGTAGYMAPEQIRDSKSVGPPADVFALGAILYECLAGKPAFEGESLVELAANVMSSNYEPLAKRRPGIPESVVRIVATALEPDLSRRYRDALELRRALEPAESVRSASGLALGAGAVIVAGLVLLGFLGTRVPAPPPPVPAPMPAPVTSRAAPPSPAAQAHALEERAAAEFAAGDFQGALDDARRAVALDATNARAWNTLGKACTRLDQLDGALDAFTRAVGCDPKLREAWFFRGALYSRLGERERALEDYTRTIEIAPGTPQPWFNRGALRRDKGDLGGAIEDATKVLEITPQDGRAYLLRGLCLRDLKVYAKAAQDLSKAVELAPDLPEAWLARATVFEKTQANASAVADYEHFLELAPDAPEAPTARASLEKLQVTIEAERLLNEANAKFEKGDYDGAIAIAEKAIAIEPKQAAHWLTRGAARERKNLHDLAIEDFTRAIELDSKYAQAYSNRAVAKKNKGDIEGAMPDYDKAIAADPTFTTGWLNRGLTRRERGDKAGALADLEKYLEVAPAGSKDLEVVKRYVSELRAALEKR